MIGDLHPILKSSGCSVHSYVPSCLVRCVLCRFTLKIDSVVPQVKQSGVIGRWIVAHFAETQRLTRNGVIYS